MVNKTFTKILSLGLGIVLVTSLLTVGIFYANYTKQAQSNLKTLATIISSEINAGGDYSFINDSYNDDTRITVIDSNGQVVCDSKEDAGKMGSHADRPEFKEALENGQGSTIRRSATIDETTYYYAIKLDSGDVLRVAVTSDSVFYIFYQSLIYIAIVCLAVMIISLALSYAITKSIVKPVTQLGENIDTIEEQNTFEELTPFVNAIKEYKYNQRLLDRQKKEFTENISHELKTPLTSIAGYAELIENGMAREEDIKPFAHTIRRQALRLVSLTEDIIQLSQLDGMNKNSVTFDIVDLSNIAKNCVESLEMNARAKNVTVRLNSESCFVNGNEAMLEEMIYNLIDNAIRYNKDGGYVTVCVDEKGIISVEDTGIGIPEDCQERIFERFFRVDKSRSKQTGGTGLGLAIVKHIAKIHSAQITIHSEENIGTKIEVSFA